MKTTTRTTKAAKITRKIHVGQQQDGKVYGLITEITHLKTQDNHMQTLYFLRRLEADFGKGVEVEKCCEGWEGDGEVYHVHLDARMGNSCTCPGGTYRGACRHLEMVRDAVAGGLI